MLCVALTSRCVLLFQLLQLHVQALIRGLCPLYSVHKQHTSALQLWSTLISVQVKFYSLETYLVIMCSMWWLPSDKEIVSCCVHFSVFSVLQWICNRCVAVKKKKSNLHELFYYIFVLLCCCFGGGVFIHDVNKSCTLIDKIKWKQEVLSLWQSLPYTPFTGYLILCGRSLKLPTGALDHIGWGLQCGPVTMWRRSEDDDSQLWKSLPCDRLVALKEHLAVI